MTVSVIMPIYNNAAVLSRTLQQLRQQTYQDVEYLLIDDGSTDSSLIVLEEVADDDRFHVYHRENAGVSAARNFGLTQATGDYVVFLDADDYYAPDLLERYVATIKESQRDMEFFSLNFVDEANQKMFFRGHQHLEGVEADQHKLLTFLGQDRMVGYPFLYISKRSLWEDVKFDETLKYQEDIAVLGEIFAKYPGIKVGFHGDVYYGYVQHEQSALHRMTVADYQQFVQVAERLYELAQLAGVSGRELARMNEKKVNAYLTIMKAAFAVGDDETFETTRQRFLPICLHVPYVDWRQWLNRSVQYGLLKMNLKEMFGKVFVAGL